MADSPACLNVGNALGGRFLVVVKVVGLGVHAVQLPQHPTARPHRSDAYAFTATRCNGGERANTCASANGLAADALCAALSSETGRHPAYDAWARAVADDTAAMLSMDPDAAQAGARALVERLALALQAATLLRADSPLADAFCRSRLGRARGMVFGTLNADVGIDSALARAWSD